MAKKQPLYPHVPKSRKQASSEAEYAPYSKESWERHLADFEEMLSNIKTGSIKVKGAYITNPNYGGYSYTEAVTRPGVTLITGMVDYADPREVLLVAEAGGLEEISLAGGWWPEAGFEGWGQKTSIMLARAKLPEWKAIFLGRLPKRTIA